MGCPFKTKPEEYFVAKGSDGDADIYSCNPDTGMCVQVSLTTEEVNFLKFVDTEVLKMIRKFTRAGFDLGRKIDRGN